MGGLGGWTRIGGWLLAGTLSLGLAGPVGAEERDTKRRALAHQAVADADRERMRMDAEPEVATVELQKKPVRYVPPRMGAPIEKVGGGARARGDWPRPLTLAPAHMAHTVAASPSLFWFIDAAPPATAEVVFTIADQENILPLAEIELPLPEDAGIQRVRLAEHGVSLQPGIEYEWSIALVRNPAVRSRDIIATGHIERVPEPLKLRMRSANTYAELGLWYDALAAASDGVEEHPDDAEIRAARNALLRQAGLSAAIDTPDVAAPVE